VDPIEAGLAIVGAALAFMVIAGLVPVAGRLDLWFARGGRGEACTGPSNAIASLIRLASMRWGKGGRTSLLSAILSPVAFAAAFMTAAAVQFSPEVSIAGVGFSVEGFSVGSGMIFSLAMISVWAAASSLPGFSSHGSGAPIEALGAISNYLSYFLAMCLSVASVLLVSRAAGFADLVDAQGHLPWEWNVVRQPVAFAIFTVCSCAALRPAFALSRSILDSRSHGAVAAAASAIGSISVRVLYVALAAISASIFLGGWQTPFVQASSVAEAMRGALPGWAIEPSLCAIGLFAMIAKTFAVMALMAFARSALPAMRQDRLMGFAWKALIPLSMANLVVTAYIAMKLWEGGTWRP